MDVRTLVITPELLKLIAEIDEFKGSWTSMQSLSPDRLQSLKHVATIESIGSSTRIEGVKLSDKEVETLLQGIGTQSFETRDEQEVAGYSEVMETIYENALDIPLTENYIKQFHIGLLRHSTKDERHRGEYKKFPNSVEAFGPDGKSLGVVFETTTPFDTPLKMEALVKWARETLEDKSLHPLIVVGVFAVTFLAIHPFQDGNGRLSRILTSLLLLKAGYSYIPFSSMESVIEKNKDAYYLNLRRTQSTLDEENPDWLPWLRFFLTSLKRQKDHLTTKLDMHLSEAYKNLSAESVLLLEYVNKHGRITTAEAHNLLNIPRPTVKTRLTKLAKDGYITQRGKGRGSFYEKR